MPYDSLIINHPLHSLVVLTSQRDFRYPQLFGFANCQHAAPRTELAPHITSIDTTTSVVAAMTSSPIETDDSLFTAPATTLCRHSVISPQDSTPYRHLVAMQCRDLGPGGHTCCALLSQKTSNGDGSSLTFFVRAGTRLKDTSDCLVESHEISSQLEPMQLEPVA